MRKLALALLLLAACSAAVAQSYPTKPVTIGVRPHPEHVAAVRATADLLDQLGHRVEEVDPGYPDPTTAFVPQFFAGVASEAAIVEHPERLERRAARERG